MSALTAGQLAELAELRQARACAECGGPVDGLGAAAERELLEISDAEERARLRAALERRSCIRICERCDRALLEKSEREEAELEARRASERRRDRERLSGVPEAFRAGGWGELEPMDPPDVLAAYQAWGRGLVRGLMTVGPVGVGKTRPAAIAAWARLDLEPVRWYSGPELLAALTSDFSDPRYRAAVDVLLRPLALVIDDIGSVRPSDHAAERIFQAIDKRYTAGAALLVTSDLTLDELADWFGERYGRRIVSRLAEYCLVRRLAGRDRRLPPLRVQNLAEPVAAGDSGERSESAA